MVERLTVDESTLPRRGARHPASAVVWSVVTVALLGGLWVDRRLFHVPSAGAGPYHARVRAAAAEAAPLRIGAWVGAEAPLPPAAVAMLNANVALSRRYQHSIDGRRVTFLFVHCSDARDVLGHFPPVCYVGAGWTPASSAARDWLVDGLPVQGMAYEFTSARLGQPERVTVLNFMVLPDGATCRDMDGISNNARDPGKKFFGVAQVQLVCEGAVAKAECDELVTTFVRANRRLIETVMTGVARHE